jgi:cytochrome c-type protein NapC
MDNDERRPDSRIRRAWTWTTTPSARFAAGALLATGVVVGVVSWAGFLRVVEHTNSLSFCTSCHVMQAFVYPEYTESHHFSNAAGVRAICADCHVPRAFLPKMNAKIRATFVEVPGWLTGRIGTQEKFDARKPEMAERVWARMRATDSRECRNCHSWEAMSAAVQAPRAWREHEAGRAEGETCVDCHQGVAHRVPASLLEADEELEFDF